MRVQSLVWEYPHAIGMTRKKMEAQTEKIQEVFNKELEDLKNKQTDEEYNN